MWKLSQIPIFIVWWQKEWHNFTKRGTIKKTVKNLLFGKMLWNFLTSFLTNFQMLRSKTGNTQRIIFILYFILHSTWINVILPRCLTFLQSVSCIHVILNRQHGYMDIFENLILSECINFIFFQFHIFKYYSFHTKIISHLKIHRIWK